MRKSSRVVGSSSRRICGRAASTLVRATSCFSPPERVKTLWSSRRSRPRSRSSSRIRSRRCPPLRALPSMAAARRRLRSISSATVGIISCASGWAKSMPTPSKAPGELPRAPVEPRLGVSRVSTPFTRTIPSSGWVSPLKSPSRVDLPLPFRPSTAVRFAVNRRLTSLRIRRCPPSGSSVKTLTDSSSRAGMLVEALTACSPCTCCGAGWRVERRKNIAILSCGTLCAFNAGQKPGTGRRGVPTNQPEPRSWTSPDPRERIPLPR